MAVSLYFCSLLLNIDFQNLCISPLPILFNEALSQILFVGYSEKLLAQRVKIVLFLKLFEGSLLLLQTNFNLFFYLLQLLFLLLLCLLQLEHEVNFHIIFFQLNDGCIVFLDSVFDLGRELDGFGVHYTLIANVYKVYNIIEMGYEQVVPPIPDRKAELEGINRLEQSWLNQPYYKFYMNESLREPKMAYANRINKVYSQFFFNTVVAAVALVPLTLLCRRLFVRQGAFPVTYVPDYFHKIRTDNQIRRWKYVKWVLPFHLLGASIVAYYFTDYEHVFDWNYEFVHKSKKMM